MSTECVVLDTETTGLSFQEDRVIEIGAIKVRKSDRKVLSTVHVYLNPGERKSSEEAIKVHGITNEFLEDKPKFKDIAKKFQEFINEKKLIIHNADFDLAFLNKELKEAGLSIISSSNVIDTLNIAREKFPGAQNSLDALCKRFKIDNSRWQKHSALLDCELLAKVYINLTDQKEPRLNFQAEEQGTKDLVNKNISYSKKVIKISALEKKRHNQYLKSSLKKNYF